MGGLEGAAERAICGARQGEVTCCGQLMAGVLGGAGGVAATVLNDASSTPDGGCVAGG
jgi:hypothetical protein